MNLPRLTQAQATKILWDHGVSCVMSTAMGEHVLEKCLVLNALKLTAHMWRTGESMEMAACAVLVGHCLPLRPEGWMGQTQGRWVTAGLPCSVAERDDLDEDAGGNEFRVRLHELHAALERWADA